MRVLARALTEVRFAPTPIPASFRATSRLYQQTGVDWLDALGRAGLGGLLADDMGLGKTIQTLAHIAVLKAQAKTDRPVLIVAPTSVLPNWQSEAARFTPDLSVLLLHGAKRHGRHADIAGHDIVLSSYPLLVRDKEVLAAERFALVVLDEVHNLKNPRTAGHHAAKALVADRKLALTGTPVENRPADAWALFDLLVSGLLGDRRRFMRSLSGPIDNEGDPVAGAHPPAPDLLRSPADRQGRHQARAIGQARSPARTARRIDTGRTPDHPVQPVHRFARPDQARPRRAGDRLGRPHRRHARPRDPGGGMQGGRSSRDPDEPESGGAPVST